MSEAVSFEAKLYAYRKDGKGTIVSFVIHPNEIPEALALADIGQRFGIALAQLREGAEPTPPPAEQSRPKNEAASERGRETYAMKDPDEQAVTRAAILCGELGFQIWIARKTTGIAIPPKITAAEDIAAFRLRRELGINSRRQIATEQAAYHAFLKLEAAYKAENGQMAERR